MGITSFMMSMMAKGGLKVKEHLRVMSYDPMKYQEKLLNDILRASENTEFGKKMGLSSIHSVEEFQKNIPLTSYDDYEPYIVRMAKGEKDLLTTNVVKHFNKTSGTMGTPKKIPTSEYSIKTFAKYYSRFLNGIPLKEIGKESFKGKGLSMNEGVAEKLACGMTFGSASSLSVARMKKMMPGLDLMSILYTSPIEAREPLKGTNTRYLHARFALMNKGITYGNVTFASFFLEMLRYIESNWEMLVNDIEKGTFDESVNLPKEARETLKKHTKPMPERAKELRKIFQEGFETPVIPKIWPHLEFFIMVGGAGFLPYTEKIKERYAGPDVHFLFLGLSASEGLFSVPIELDNFDAAFVPDGCFLEFLPLGEEDLSKIVTLKDLKVGEKYEIIITNTAGFLRYRMRDGIIVTNMFNNLPMMQFLYRVDNTVSITGEKTTEVALTETVARTAKELNIDIVDYSLYPDTNNVPARYVFLLEIDKKPESITIEQITNSIEKHLAETNPSMGDKVKTGVCAPTLVKLLQPQTYLLYRDCMVYKGTSAAQLKPVHVIRNEVQRKFFFVLTEE